jgi:hypothetical protein
VSYTTPELPADIFGDYVMVQSQGTTGRTWTRLQDLDASKGSAIHVLIFELFSQVVFVFSAVGSSVWLRARVHNARGKGNSCFLVLRSNM